MAATLPPLALPREAVQIDPVTGLPYQPGQGSLAPGMSAPVATPVPVPAVPLPLPAPVALPTPPTVATTPTPAPHTAPTPPAVTLAPPPRLSTPEPAPAPIVRPQPAPYVPMPSVPEMQTPSGGYSPEASLAPEPRIALPTPADLTRSMLRTTAPAPIPAAVPPTVQPSAQQQPQPAPAQTPTSAPSNAPAGLREIARQAAANSGIDPDMFERLVTQESGWNPNARGGAGEIGLTQLMPTTARGLGVTNPYDPVQNLQAGARYLRQQIDYFGGDVAKGLAAYNAGAGNVEKGIIPPTTQGYVRNILGGGARFAPLSAYGGSPVANTAPPPTQPPTTPGQPPPWANIDLGGAMQQGQAGEAAGAGAGVQPQTPEAAAAMPWGSIAQNAALGAGMGLVTGGLPGAAIGGVAGTLMGQFPEQVANIGDTLGQLPYPSPTMLTTIGNAIPGGTVPASVANWLMLNAPGYEQAGAPTGIKGALSRMKSYTDAFGGLVDTLATISGAADSGNADLFNTQMHTLERGLAAAGASPAQFFKDAHDANPGLASHAIDFLADPGNLAFMAATEGIGPLIQGARAVAGTVAAGAKELAGGELLGPGTRPLERPGFATTTTAMSVGAPPPGLGGAFEPRAKAASTQIDALLSKAASAPEADQPALMAQVDRLSAEADRLQGIGEQANSIRAEIEGLQAANAGSPAEGYAAKIIPTSGQFAGSIPEDVTLSTYTSITGNRTIGQSNYNSHGRIPIHIAVDEPASTAGMTTDQFLSEVQRYNDRNQRVAALTRELRTLDEQAKVNDTPSTRQRAKPAAHVPGVVTGQAPQLNPAASAEPLPPPTAADFGALTPGSKLRQSVRSTADAFGDMGLADPVLRQALYDDPRNYHTPIVDREVMAAANQAVQADPQAVRARVLATKGAFTGPTDAAEAMALLNKSYREGDIQGVIDLATAIAPRGTETAQALQMMGQKGTSPEGIMLQAARGWQEAVARQGGTELPPRLQDAVVRAQIEQETAPLRAALKAAEQQRSEAINLAANLKALAEKKAAQGLTRSSRKPVHVDDFLSQMRESFGVPTGRATETLGMSIGLPPPDSLPAALKPKVNPVLQFTPAEQEVFRTRADSIRLIADPVEKAKAQGAFLQELQDTVAQRKTAAAAQKAEARGLQTAAARAARASDPERLAQQAEAAQQKAYAQAAKSGLADDRAAAEAARTNAERLRQQADVAQGRAYSTAARAELADARAAELTRLKAEGAQARQDAAQAAKLAKTADKARSAYMNAINALAQQKADSYDAAIASLERQHTRSTQADVETLNNLLHASTSKTATERVPQLQETQAINAAMAQLRKAGADLPQGRAMSYLIEARRLDSLPVEEQKAARIALVDEIKQYDPVKQAREAQAAAVKQAAALRTQAKDLIDLTTAAHYEARARVINAERAAVATAKSRFRAAGVDMPEGVARNFLDRASAAGQMEQGSYDQFRAYQSIVQDIQRFVPPTGWQSAMKVLNMNRGWAATGDLSYLLRQGILTAPLHPLQWLDTVKVAHRALFSEEAATAVDRMYFDLPLSKVMRDSGLEWVDRFGQRGAGEEGFSVRPPSFNGISDNPLVEGARTAGRTVGRTFDATERSFTTAGNKQRADIWIDTVSGWLPENLRGMKFNSLDDLAHATGKPKESFEVLSKLLNAATGRGNIAKTMKQYNQVASIFFWAPRFMVSRFQVPYYAVRYGLNPMADIPFALRKELVGMVVADAVVGFAALNVIDAGLRWAGVGSVNWDMKSSDGGKIRIGNEHYDFFAGYGPLMRTIVQSISGEHHTASGATEQVGHIEPWLNFVRDKLAFWPGLAWSMNQGTDPGGNPVRTWQQIAGQIVQAHVPMTGRDVYDAAKTEGWGAAIRTGVANFYGGGASVYSNRGDLKDQTAQRLGYAKDYRDLGKSDQQKVDADPAVKAFEAQQQAANADAPPFGGSTRYEQGAIAATLLKEAKATSEAKAKAAIEQGASGKRLVQVVQELRKDSYQAGQNIYGGSLGAALQAGKAPTLLESYKDAYLNVDAPEDPLTGDINFKAQEQGRADVLRQAAAAGVNPADITDKGTAPRYSDPVVQAASDAYDKQLAILKRYYDIPDQLQAGNAAYAAAATQYDRLKAQSGTPAGLRAFQDFQRTNRDWQNYFVDMDTQKKLLRLNNPELDATGAIMGKWQPITAAAAKLAGVIP